MATKKEGAKRLLDTLDSKGKLQNRLRFAISQGVLLSILIGYFTEQWRFGLAALLLFGLLIQFSFERIADLGWKDSSLSDEEYRIRLMKVLNG